jgi:hypothetical protein
VLCAITREALSRLAGVRPSGEQDCRWVFDAHRATIETVLKARYAAGRIGPFSTILLTSKDFP